MTTLEFEAAAEENEAELQEACGQWKWKLIKQTHEYNQSMVIVMLNLLSPRVIAATCWIASEWGVFNPIATICTISIGKALDSFENMQEGFADLFWIDLSDCRISESDKRQAMQLH